MRAEGDWVAIAFVTDIRHEPKRGQVELNDRQVSRELTPAARAHPRARACGTS